MEIHKLAFLKSRAKSKVMFIDLNLEPGGSVISIVDLAKKLADQGFGSILIKPRGNLWDGIVNLGDLNVFQVLSYPWVQHRSLDNHLLRKIKRKIKSVINFGSEIKIFLLVKFYQVEFVHINTANFQIGHKAARWADVKLVWHIREVLDLGHNTAFHNPEFAKLMISSADLVIGNSKATCSVWADILDRPVELAYNGISPSFLNQNRRLFQKSEITLGIVGRICENKGQYHFIKSISALMDLDLNLKVRIVGDGDISEKQKLIDYVQKNSLESVVSFQPATNDIRRVYTECDIVCVCTEFEAFGRVTVEALLSGCLVIGANTGGTCEIIEHDVSGYLYRWGDHLDLKEMILKALNSPEKSRVVAKAGQEYAVKKFLLDEHVDRIKGLYRSQHT